MTASAVPTSVFAASIGSSSANTSMGMDTTQNATTQYTEVAPSNAQTKVCLTIDDSDLVVSLPTSVVLSGTPDAQGKYIGKYSVGVSGDMSGSKSVKIKPEGTAQLTQSGAQNKTASITQQKTTFTTEDFKNKAKTEGAVSADSLTAGSWTGDFNFNVGY